MYQSKETNHSKCIQKFIQKYYKLLITSIKNCYINKSIVLKVILVYKCAKLILL